jgi:hypothetical protein
MKLTIEEKLETMTDALVNFIGTRDVKKLKSMRKGYLQLAEVSDDSGEPSDDLNRITVLLDSLILALQK